MFLAGVAGVDITPKPGPILQGHWSLNPSHGVLLPLHVQALVMQAGSASAAIISADVLGVSREQTRTIRTLVAQATSIPADNLMICASHTHSAPAVLPIIGQEPDEAFVDALIKGAVDCVVRANADLAPVRMGLGGGAAHFNVNRRPRPNTTDMCPNDAAVIDHRVRLLRIDRLDGSPLAVLFHFACHPTTKSGSEGWISSDFPGAARAYVARHLQCPAMFVPGCFANVRPRVLDDNNRFRSATADEVIHIGETLGCSVVRAAKSTCCADVESLKSQQVSISVPFAGHPPKDLLQTKLRDDSAIGVKVNAPWAQRVQQLIDSGAMPASEETFMQAMRIGPVMLVSVPGEPVLEIGMAIERTLLQACPDIHDVWSVGYTNDMLGYLCTEAHHSEGGYEPTAYVYFDRPAAFRDEEKVLVDGARRLAHPR
jgi:hypothetical protein